MIMKNGALIAPTIPAPEKVEENVDAWFDPSVADDDADKEHTWTGQNPFWFNLYAFTIQRFLSQEADDVFEIKVEHRRSFEVEPGERHTYICKGVIVYSLKGRLVACHADCEEDEVTISAKYDIKRLVERLKAEIKYRNPLRGHHIQIVPCSDWFRAAIRPVPKTSFTDLILDRELVEDIYDNTIFQLKATQLNNGLIFYGEPGTGKSLACQAVARDAVAEGFSSIFVSAEVDFTLLGEFIAEFMAPCVLVLEDVDSFAGTREDGSNKDSLSDFLQFLSGVCERKEQVIVIATTNYLDRLDKAVQDRPVRFNRKYYFERPQNRELDQLLDLQFGPGILSAWQKKLCHDREFSGAHVAELKRTAMTLSRKHGKSEAEVFEETIKIIIKHFGGAKRCLGFGSSDGKVQEPR